MEPASFVLLALAAFTGSAIQGAFGFGFAILAAPVFLVVMNSSGAVPVLAVLNFAVSFAVALLVWRQTPLRLFGLLALGSVAGVPIGLGLFHRASVAELKLAVGIVIMSFALLLLARERGYATPVNSKGAGVSRPSRTGALVAGLLSGVMGAALAMPGPAAMLYLSTLRLPKEESRAVSLVLFSFSYALISGVHAASGGLDVSRLLLIGELLLFVLLGALAGQRLTRYISEARFRVLVLLILFLAGFSAVVASL